MELPKPLLRRGEVLVRVCAASVSSGDWRVRSLQVPAGLGLPMRLMFGFRRPRQPVLGTDCAGLVEQVGEGVTAFRPGDRVVAFPDMRMGCHAEYVSIPADGMITTLPENISYAEGTALCFGGLTAQHFLERAGVRKGDQVLVVGASGSVGVALVQLAQMRGAAVTGVCSAANMDLVANLGAIHVVDYGRCDILREPNRYDVILDTTGGLPRRSGLSLLKPGGRLALVAAGIPDMLHALVSRGKIIASPAVSTRTILEELVGLAAAGRYRAVIDRTYPLSEIVDAHAYVGTRRKRGNVVLRVAPDTK